VDYYSALVDEKGMFKGWVFGRRTAPNAKGYELMAPLADAIGRRCSKTHRRRLAIHSQPHVRFFSDRLASAGRVVRVGVEWTSWSVGRLPRRNRYLVRLHSRGTLRLLALPLCLLRSAPRRPFGRRPHSQPFLQHSFQGGLFERFVR